MFDFKYSRIIVVLLILGVLSMVAYGQRSRPSPTASKPVTPPKPPVVQQSKPIVMQPNPKSQPTYSQPVPSARPVPKPPSKPLPPLNSIGDIKSVPTNSYANKSYKQLSPSDQKLVRDAKANGTLFKTRDEATADFKSRYSSQYQSKFQAEPTTRPAYIPSTYVNDGVTYNINYNPAYGGYGYTNSLGAFILYDAMSDAIMMNHLMNHHGYAYDMDPDTVVVQQSTSWLTVFLSIMGIIFIIIIIIAVIRN